MASSFDDTIKQLLELGAPNMKKSGINVSAYSEKDINLIEDAEYIQNEIKFDKDVVLTKQLRSNNANDLKKLSNDVNFEKWMKLLFKEQSPAFAIFAKIDEKQAILTEFSKDGSLGEHLKKGIVNIDNIKLIAQTLCKLHNTTDAISSRDINSNLSRDFSVFKDETQHPYLSEVFATKHKSLIISNLNGNSIYIHNKTVKFLSNGGACIGPRSLDLGHLVAEYLIQYYLHILTEEDNDRHRRIAYEMVNASTTTIATYCESFDQSADTVSDFIWEVARCTGEEIINRSKLLSRCDRLSEISGAGHRLINARTRITDEHRLVNIALMLTF